MNVSYFIPEHSIVDRGTLPINWSQPSLPNAELRGVAFSYTRTSRAEILRSL